MKKVLLTLAFIQFIALLTVVDLSVCSQPTFKYEKPIFSEQQPRFPNLRSGDDGPQKVCADVVTSQLAEILSKCTDIDKFYDPTDETPPTILLDEGFAEHLSTHYHTRDFSEDVLIFEGDKSKGGDQQLLINTSIVGKKSPGYSAFMEIDTKQTGKLRRELRSKYEQELGHISPDLCSLFEDVYTLFEKKVLSYTACDQEFMKKLLAVNRVMLHTTNTVDVRLQYKKGGEQLSAVICMPIRGTEGVIKGYNLLSVINFLIIEFTATGEPSKINRTGRLTTMFISTPSYQGAKYTPLEKPTTITEARRDTVYRMCTDLLKRFKSIECTSKEQAMLRDLAFKVKRHSIDDVFKKLNNKNVSKVFKRGNMRQRIQDVVDIFYDLSLYADADNEYQGIVQHVRSFMNWWEKGFPIMGMKLHEILWVNTSGEFIQPNLELGLDVTNPCFLLAAIKIFREKAYEPNIGFYSPVRQLILIFQCLSDAINEKNLNSDNQWGIFNIIKDAIIGKLEDVKQYTDDEYKYIKKDNGPAHSLALERYSGTEAIMNEIKEKIQALETKRKNLADNKKGKVEERVYDEIAKLRPSSKNGVTVRLSQKNLTEKERREILLPLTMKYSAEIEAERDEIFDKIQILKFIFRQIEEGRGVYTRYDDDDEIRGLKERINTIYLKHTKKSPLKAHLLLQI